MNAIQLSKIWLCNIFSHLSRDTSVFNTESRGFNFNQNAFKVRSSDETLWLPDNTDGLPQYYIVNFFRHLPKSNLQIVAEVISIRDLCVEMCGLLSHYLWGILSDYSFRAVVQVHIVCFD